MVADEALLAIEGYMRDITGSISLISNAAGQQAIASSEVSESVNAMSDISNRTMEEAMATTRSAQSLKDIGQSVSQLLKQFKI